MKDGLMKFVEETNPEQAASYENLRGLLNDAIRIRMPWCLYRDSKEFIPEMQVPEGIKKAIQRVSLDLYNEGWGYLPEVKSSLIGFHNQSLPENYQGFRPAEGIQDLMFPTAEDLGQKIKIDNISYNIAADSNNNFVAARVLLSPLFEGEFVYPVMGGISMDNSDVIWTRFCQPCQLSVNYANIEDGLKIDRTQPKPRFALFRGPDKYLSEALVFQNIGHEDPNYEPIMSML